MNQFEALVKAMRCEQKAYFATRQKAHLFRSKELEKQVDDYLNKTTTPVQNHASVNNQLSILDPVVLVPVDQQKFNSKK